MENYPPELWDCIASYIPGEQLGRLKMTGFKKLWRRLCEPRSVKVINLGEDDLTFHKWPAFLNEFPGVEDFGIRNTDENWWRTWGPKLSNVPPTVKKLRIHGPKEASASFFLSDFAPIPLIQYVPLLECLWISAAWSFEMTAEEYPPNLTSLRCSYWDFQVPLPSSLLHFDARVIHTFKPSCCPLPPNLESFCIDTSPNGIIQFPSSLRTLKWYSPTATAKFNSLPKELVTLQINLKEKILYDPILQTAPSTLLSFPTALVCLIVGCLPSQCWSYLPKTLQKLALTDLTSSSITYSINLPAKRRSSDLVDGEEAESPGEILTIPIHTLPKSLTYLSLSFWDLVLLDYPCDNGEEHEYHEGHESTVSSSKDGDASSSVQNTSHSGYQLFPPNLEYLTLFDVQISDRAARQLPRSLTYLHVNNLDDNIFKYLPRRLRHLGSMRTKWTNPISMNDLPASLTTLVLRASLLGRTQWYDTDTGLLYIEGKPGQLAPSLPSLGLNLPAPSVSLPSHESVDPDEVSEEPSWHLPSGLNKLTLDGLKKFNPRILKKLKYLSYLALLSTTLSHEAIVYFPRYLTHLQLITSSRLSGKCIPDLPSQLIYLDLTYKSELSEPEALNLEEDVVDFLDSDLQHLPPNLSHLVLTPATHLTNECAKYLPKRLCSFQVLKNARITPDILPLLPYPMRSSQNYRSFVNKIFIISKGILYRDRDMHY